MRPLKNHYTDPKTCNKNLICIRTSAIMTIENKAANGFLAEVW